MNTTARMALQNIPEHLQNEAVFLCIDDTMVAEQKHQVILLFDSWYTKKISGLSCIFGDRYIYSYVTATNKTTETRRRFFSTIAPENIRMSCTWQEKAPLNKTGRDWMQYVPLFVHSFRWNIEVSYYEQKNFWSLCAYMVRSKKGIETLVNLINISYCAMKRLPYKDEAFSRYKDISVREFRLALSQQISQQVIFATFVENVETTIKSNTFVKALKS